MYIKYEKKFLILPSAELLLAQAEARRKRLRSGDVLLFENVCVGDVPLVRWAWPDGMGRTTVTKTDESRRGRDDYEPLTLA